MRMFNSGRNLTGSAPHRYPRAGSMTIESIPEVPGEESGSGSRNGTTSSSSRPAFQLPFQSRSVSQSISESPAQHARSTSRSTSFPRRNSGWINLRPASSVLGSDVIPDYVVNFIRGETPESLARRKEREGSTELHGGRSDNFHAGELLFPHSRLGSRGKDLEDILASGGRKSAFLRRFMAGWRGGVALSMSLALVIMLAAVVCLILAAATNRISTRPAAIVSGRCSRVRAIDLGVDAVVNVFALFFLAGANYAAQILVSPTRTEVSAAHQNLHWLDIGIPSLRNLVGISKKRAMLSVTVVITAVASQVLYNSILSTTGTTTWAGDSASCSLVINGALLAAVAGLNLLFILALGVVQARSSSANPLVTLGDAIASFLAEPDHATEGACLVTKSDIKSGRWGCGEARYWFTQSHRWAQTPSRTRWLVWFVVWLLPSGMAAAMLSMAMVDGPEKNAFGSLGKSTSSYALPRGIPRLGDSIVLALPHLLLAMLYFSTNAMLSVFYLSHEFSQFAAPGACSSLRISSSRPLGSQTTSFYLTLPQPLSWLLFILFVAMGFMLSQSFDLVAIDGEPFLGLNPLPLVILLGLLVLMAVITVGLSLRRTDIAAATADGRRAGNPLALKGGSCSAVISARCHRSTFEGADLALLPLAWGVVHDGGTEGKVGHATFSSQPVDPLSVAKAYA